MAQFGMRVVILAGRGVKGGTGGRSPKESVGNHPLDQIAFLAHLHGAQDGEIALLDALFGIGIHHGAVHVNAR